MESSSKGILSDRFMQEMSVKPDTNYANHPAHCYSDCKSYQRSKSLSHVYQREQRIAASSVIFQKEKEKGNVEKLKLDSIHMLNNLATELILTLLPKPTHENPLEGVSYNILYKLSVEQLQAFIHVRKFDRAKVKFKWRKKGKINKAEDGEEDLLAKVLEYSTVDVTLPINLVGIERDTPPEAVDLLSVNPPTRYCVG